MNNDTPELFEPAFGKRGMTMMHYAAYCGDSRMLADSISKGMNPNIKDSYRGYTPLLWLMDMAATGGPRVEMLHSLVRCGADVHVKSDDGASALSLARDAGNQTGDELVEVLLALGAMD